MGGPSSFIYCQIILKVDRQSFVYCLKTFILIAYHAGSTISMRTYVGLAPGSSLFGLGCWST